MDILQVFFILDSKLCLYLNDYYSQFITASIKFSSEKH